MKREDNEHQRDVASTCRKVSEENGEEIERSVASNANGNVGEIKTDDERAGIEEEEASESSDRSEDKPVFV